MRRSRDNHIASIGDCPLCAGLIGDIDDLDLPVLRERLVKEMARQLGKNRKADPDWPPRLRFIHTADDDHPLSRGQWIGGPVFGLTSDPVRGCVLPGSIPDHRWTTDVDRRRARTTRQRRRESGAARCIGMDPRTRSLPPWCVNPAEAAIAAKADQRRRDVSPRLRCATQRAASRAHCARGS